VLPLCVAILLFLNRLQIIDQLPDPPAHHTPLRDLKLRSPQRYIAGAMAGYFLAAVDHPIRPPKGELPSLLLAKLRQIRRAGDPQQFSHHSIPLPIRSMAADCLFGVPSRDTSSPSRSIRDPIVITQVQNLIPFGHLCRGDGGLSFGDNWSAPFR
jgi:hypothetical protein